MSKQIEKMVKDSPEKFESWHSEITDGKKDYWVYCAPPYYCPEMECGTIHEFTVKETLEKMRTVVEGEFNGYGWGPKGIKKVSKAKEKKTKTREDKARAKAAVQSREKELEKLFDRALRARQKDIAKALKALQKYQKDCVYGDKEKEKLRRLLYERCLEKKALIEMFESSAKIDDVYMDSAGFYECLSDWDDPLFSTYLFCTVKGNEDLTNLALDNLFSRIYSVLSRSLFGK